MDINLIIGGSALIISAIFNYVREEKRDEELKRMKEKYKKEIMEEWNSNDALRNRIEIHEKRYQSFVKEHYELEGICSTQSEEIIGLKHSLKKVKEENKNLTLNYGKRRRLT